MLRRLLVFQLLVFAYSWAYAQQNYSLSGKIDACYEAEHKETISKGPINLVLSSVSADKVFTVTTDRTESFSFQQLPAGTYMLKATILGFPDSDTTIHVTNNINNLTFCIDKAYRPANADSVANYKNRALIDIKAGQTRIYEWTALSITDDPFRNINPKVKKKYGFEYEMMGCVRPVTRDEIVQVKLWEAYNEVVYEHLTKIHGPNWRKTIKHERTKMRIEKL